MAVRNLAIDGKQNKSILNRSLSESLTVLFMLASDQADMSIESLCALVRAVLNRRKNLLN